ncbi:unnamed protein product [Urochloa humidicola]
MKKLAPLSSLPAVYVLVAVILIITIPSVVVRGSEVRAQDAAVSVPRLDGGREGSAPLSPRPGGPRGALRPCCL